MKEPTKAELIDVLRFYTDPATHEARMEGERSVWPILDDKGRKARAVLGIPEPPTPLEELQARLAAIDRGEIPV